MDPNASSAPEQVDSSQLPTEQAQPVDHRAKKHVLRRAVFAATAIVGVGSNAHTADAAAPQDTPPAATAEPAVETDVPPVPEPIEDTEPQSAPTTEPIVQTDVPPVPSTPATTELPQNTEIPPSGIYGDAVGHDGVITPVSPDNAGIEDRSSDGEEVSSSTTTTSTPNGIYGDAVGHDGVITPVTPDNAGTEIIPASTTTTTAAKPESTLPATGAGEFIPVTVIAAGAAVGIGGSLTRITRRPENHK
jgi:hypothetical protein